MAKIKLKKPVKKYEPGLCYDCKFAYLMRSADFNPIVAQCEKYNCRQVAMLHICDREGFEKNDTDERTIHPMINLDKK